MKEEIKRRGPRALGDLKRTEKYTVFFTKQESLLIQALSDTKGVCVGVCLHELIKKALETNPNA